MIYKILTFSLYILATSCTKQINEENCKMHYPKIPSKSDEGFVKTSENIATPILTVFWRGSNFTFTHR